MDLKLYPLPFSIKKGIWNKILYEMKIDSINNSIYLSNVKKEINDQGEEIKEYNLVVVSNFVGKITQIYYTTQSNNLPFIKIGYEDTENFHIEYRINPTDILLEITQEISEKNANYTLYRLPKNIIVEQIYYVVPKI